jgi:hypothetical protein
MLLQGINEQSPEIWNLLTSQGLFTVSSDETRH